MNLNIKHISAKQLSHLFVTRTDWYKNHLYNGHLTSRECSNLSDSLWGDEELKGAAEPSGAHRFGDRLPLRAAGVVHAHLHQKCDAVIVGSSFYIH